MQQQTVVTVDSDPIICAQIDFFKKCPIVEAALCRVVTLDRS